MFKFKWKRLNQASPAQAIVEFALILTVLLMIIFIIIESARILWAWNTVQNATREAARYAITGQTEDPCPDELTDTKFGNLERNLCTTLDDNNRVASITNRAYQALSGLPLNETVPFGGEGYYDIIVYGPGEAGGEIVMVANSAGAPNEPVAVQVAYYVPIITPLLRPIAETVPVFGQTILYNESFGQLATNIDPQGLPAPIPGSIPTIGPTPTPTPSPTQTNTPTPGATPTETATPTSTITPVPATCPTHFEGAAVAGNTHVLVTGQVGSEVSIILADTGETLATTTLIAVSGHDCDGFADFIAPVHPALSKALEEGWLLIAVSDDGSFDDTFVIGSPPTETPTSTNTPPPSPTPSNTPTVTPTHTPTDPYIVLLPNCSNSTTAIFTVQGFNWPADEDILIYWNTSNFISKIDQSQHSGAFSRTFNIPNVPANSTYDVVAITNSLSETSTATFEIPCPNYTPVPETATPTSTPRPADLVMISPPQLVSTRPIVSFEPVEFSVVITNTGDIDVNQQFFVDLYFDPTDVYSTYIPIDQSVGFSAISGLPGGATQVITITAPLGFENDPNPHIAYGMVDSLQAPLGGQIAESSEENNVSDPATIFDVTPGATPTPTPTFDPGGSKFISGIVQSRVIQWVPQARATVFLVDSDNKVIASRETDLNGFYEFQNVDDGTYSVYSCIEIDNLGYFGIRTGITPPNTLANIYMLPGPCTIDPPTNDLPTVTNPGNQFNDVDETVNLPIGATDANGDTLTYSATGLPPGLSIDPNSGVISGSLPHSSQGIYSVSVSVFDGTDTTTIFFQWTVYGFKAEAITVSNVNSSSWTTVNLTNSYKSMVAVCTVNYQNNGIPELVRMQNATSGTSFDIRLQNPSGSTLANETVHCIVAEEGKWQTPGGRNIEAYRFNSTVTDRRGSWNGQNVSYQLSYTNPVVLGQVMTYNDTDWSVFWSYGDSTSRAPNADLHIGKHVGEDPDTTRNNETLGYIVIEEGYEIVNGTEVEVGISGDSVQGVTNSPPYSSNFSRTLGNTPAVGVLTQGGMDGAHGSWAVLYGNTPLTPSQVRLAVDEDQAGDSERNHTTEQIGYIIFGDPLILTGTE